MAVGSSAMFRRIAYAESIGDGVLPIVEIDHPNLAEPLRFVRNGESITSNGVVYAPLFFNILPPELASDGRVTTSKLKIDCVDQRM